MSLLTILDADIKQQTELIKKYAAAAVVIMAAVIVLEVLLFNFRHWQSINNAPVTAEYIYSENLIAEDVNAFRVVSTETAPYVEVSDIDLDIENIALDVTFPELGVTAVEDVKYHFEVIDQGNRNRYALPSMEFLHLVPQSHFDYLDLYGNAKNIRLCFDNLKDGELIRIEYLIFNSKVPLMISKKRMLALFAFLYLLFLLRPGSFLYYFKAGEKSRIRTISVIMLIVLEIGFSWWAINLNGAFKDIDKDGQRQFMLLAEALAQGETHLLLEPSEALRQMEDPYDTTERLRVCTGDEEALWDTAYYNGHYYVYFGVGPILMYYLPYYIITGQHINTIIVVFINAVLIFLAVPLLLKELMERWFADTPLAAYLILTAIVSWGSGLWYLIMNPDFYGVPLATAMALCFFGLYFWIHALSEKGIRIPFIAAGSLCMAFEAAVRPQFLLVSFAAVLIFWRSIFKKRELFSKKGFGATLGFIIPYAVIAAGVMYYNFDRFGSVFDFGANYNLTNNNMPYRGFHLDRLLYAVFGFLFMPSTVTNSFPYYTMSSFTTTYQGPTGDELLLGGLIYNYTFLAVTLVPVLFKKFVKKRELYIFTLAAPLAALTVMIVDANMAGVIMRYNADFAWYFMISFVVILSSVICELKSSTVITQDQSTTKIDLSERKLLEIIYWLLLICFAAFMIRSFLYLFTGLARPDVNAKLSWHTVKHLIEFWH